MLAQNRAAMFTPEQRDGLRREILDRAANDDRISGGAITGSLAAGNEDRWSDIDLAFGVRKSEDFPAVLADWTAHMREQHQVLHHFDVRSGAWTYRVFFLPNTLQVDLAFVPAPEFRALSPSFKLVFGSEQEPRLASSAQPADLIGLACICALHARSSLARGHLWRAEYMISGVRDNALALACVRHGLPAAYGRGLDSLPAGVAAKFTNSLAQELAPRELSRALRVAVCGLLSEIRHVDQSLADRLEDFLLSLTEIQNQ